MNGTILNPQVAAFPKVASRQAPAVSGCSCSLKNQKRKQHRSWEPPCEHLQVIRPTAKKAVVTFGPHFGERGLAEDHLLIRQQGLTGPQPLDTYNDSPRRTLICRNQSVVYIKISLRANSKPAAV
jgi:hypothetical protein